MKRLRLPKNKILVLDVARWARRTKSVSCGPSQLLNGEDNMCCLGQFCMQCGVNKDSMLGLSGPDDLEPCSIQLMTYNKGNSRFSSNAISINDDDTTDDFQKIKELEELCAENGVKLVVINRHLATKYSKGR